MAKFKIIEEGRILTNQALAQVQGGIQLCIDASTFRNCISGSKVVCNTVLIQPCVNQNLTCDGNLKVCGDGMKSVCGGNKSIIIGGIIS